MATNTKEMATNTKEWSLYDYLKVDRGVDFANLGEMYTKVTVRDRNGEKREIEKKLSTAQAIYVTLLGILDKSREELHLEILTQTLCGEPGAGTCKFCFEHWLGQDHRYIALPTDRVALKKWQTVYTATPDKMAEVLAQKTKTAKVEPPKVVQVESDNNINYSMFSEKFFWDKEMVQSMCMFIMHELHPENVHFFVYTEREESDKGVSTYSIRLDKKSRFLLVVVEQKQAKKFCIYVFDLERGQCEVLDPIFVDNSIKRDTVKRKQRSNHCKVRINSLSLQMLIHCGKDADTIRFLQKIECL